jgi:hypothetical protein
MDETLLLSALLLRLLGGSLTPRVLDGYVTEEMRYPPLLKV